MIQKKSSSMILVVALALAFMLTPQLRAQLVLPGDETIIDPFDPVSGIGVTRFGESLALDGELLVVGAPWDDVEVAGYNRGAVYIFERVGNVWTPQQKLVASDGEDEDYFGTSVDVAEGIGGLDDYIIVGAPDARRINAGPDGKVYLFRRSGGGPWEFETQLEPNSEEPSSQFGTAVAIDVSVPANSQTGDPLFTAAATAPWNDDPDDIGLRDNGSVSIYQFVGGPPSWQWTHEFYGPTYSPNQEIFLGRSLALDEGLLMAGAPSWDGDAFNSGQARLYSQGNQQPGGHMEWNFASRLQASSQVALEELGNSVAVSMDTGVGLVGARNHDGERGAVYVFDVLAFGTVRTEVQMLLASDGAAGHRFGAAVDIDGRIAVIGAPRAEEAGDDVGAIYVFEQANGLPNSWVEVGRILASDAVNSPSDYGEEVAISDLVTVTGRAEYGGSVEGVTYLNDLRRELFSDGFESGDVSIWSSSTGMP